MTNPRPYALQLTTEQALAELRRCAGAQFDPQVVAVLAGVVADTLVQPSR
jgi:HD-GYP domain-containing protein (c-di-GMP phosphodiesterase class II)